MCGICGFTWQDQGLIENMTETMAHRGPDTRGFFLGEGATIGQSRLSIVDLSPAGNQPMFNEDRTVALTANGEIYNQIELREELTKKGHVFSSNSDNETIIHGYEEWGPLVVERLQGMFAFCLWDMAKKRMLLVRDRLGIKPLYYHHDGGRLIFASEIKAILDWPGINREVDPTAFYQYLGYEFVPAPRTLFKGIKKLPQGHFALFDLNSGNIKLEKYWDLKFEPAFKEPGEAVEELRSLMQTSVKRRLMSDVPLGVFLSGGLDSTSVVALMKRLGVEKPKSFSIAYPDPSFSELEYAEDMAEHYGTEPEVLMIKDLTLEDLEKAVYHLDEPMTDLSAIPLMLICRKAKEKVTVVLSGEGGDEVFCGYDRFKASKAAGYLSAIPGLAPSLGFMAGQFADRPQKKGAVNIFKRFVEGMNLPKEGEHLRWQYFLAPNLAEELFTGDFKQMVNLDPFGPVRKVLESCNSGERLDREVYADLRLTMVDSVLMKVDKMSMSTSLEVRVPFLDHEFVEFTAKLPGWFKLKGFTTKYILRHAIEGLVPKRVAWRGKQGYSLPVKNLLRHQMKDLMKELLTQSPLVKDYLEPKVVARLMDEHLRGVANHNHVLWALMNAALWHRRFLEA